MALGGYDHSVMRCDTPYHSGSLRHVQPHQRTAFSRPIIGKPELRTLLDQCGNLFLQFDAATIARMALPTLIPPLSVLWTERIPCSNKSRSAPAWVDEFLPLAGHELLMQELVVLST